MSTIKSNLGLDSIGNLSDLLKDSETSDGRPVELTLSLIEEDIEQPRTEFNLDSLNELAETIITRGIKTPISVRNSDIPGKYIINHGARRYRASKLAGKTTIPAFIDDDYSKADQVIENIQRDNLNGREIANFIGRQRAEGKKPTQIAKEIGKSGSYVTQHSAMLDLPEKLSVIFNNRTCDVTAMYELAKLHKKDSDAVESYLAEEIDEITRSSVKQLAAYIAEKQSNGGIKNDDPDHDNDSFDYSSIKPSKNSDKITKTDDSNKMKRSIVLVTHEGRPARLMLSKRPTARGLAWCKYDDGEEIETVINRLVLQDLIEG